MSAPNDESKPATNMDALKQQAEACGAGCSCHAPAASGRTRWMLGAVILAAAAVLAVRAVMKTTAAAAATTARASAAVAAFAAAPRAGVAVTAEPAGAVAPATAVTPGDGADAAAATAPAAAPAAQALPGVVGRQIGAFAELNTLAADTTAVLVFVPGKGADSTVPPTAPMEAAARTIAAQGNKIGLFTLKAEGPDYEQMVGQVTVPGVLALVKGRGMQAVAGEITETKLVQAFVAASSAGGCSSGGCGAAAAGCK